VRHIVITTRKATASRSITGSSSTQWTWRLCDDQDVISETGLPYQTSCWLGVSRMSCCWISMLPAWRQFKTLFTANCCLQPVQSYMANRTWRLPVLQATDPQLLEASCCVVWCLRFPQQCVMNILFFCRMTLFCWTVGSRRFEGTF